MLVIIPGGIISMNFPNWDKTGYFLSLSLNNSTVIFQPAPPHNFPTLPLKESLFAYKESV